MSVYVDNARYSYGRMNMCHMLADTPEELFAMAYKIRVARRWYQSFAKASCPHFDIALSKRKLAIAAGAIEVERAEMVDIMQRIKVAAMNAVADGKPHGWGS